MLEEAGLTNGDEVIIEVFQQGELRIRRGDSRFESAFGAMTGMYPPNYLARLDAEDAER